MIHARQDYNNRVQDSDNIIPAHEPVFLLRGQDSLAPGILREYVDRLKAVTGKTEMTDALTAHADAMEQWQNDVYVKTPDMPEGESIY